MSNRILVIATDDALVRAMSEQLTARGHAVDTTPEGDDGIQRARGSPPALVVVQVELAKGQNGYLVCARLKKDEALSRVPVLIVGERSGFAQHQKLKTRADGYVAWPADVAELVEEVERLLRGESAAPREAAPVAEPERRGLRGWLRGLLGP